MQQVYHSNANTNINIRTLLQNNSETNSVLATKFNISCQTVSKWKNRDFQKDAFCKSLNIKYALTDSEKAIAISLRKLTWCHFIMFGKFFWIQIQKYPEVLFTELLKMNK